MLATSDDDGETWTDPRPIYAYPGWFCLAMGGLARVADENVKLLLGRIFIDFSLGGTEPMTGWWVASTTSRDGGETWSEPVAGDPPLPPLDRAVRREQSAPAVRRPAAVGGDGHQGP